MCDDQVVRLAALQDGLDVIQPLVGEVLVHGVHDGDLLVDDGIGIVGHAVGYDVLTLEEVHLVVVNADLLDVVGDMHSHSPCCSFSDWIIHHFL